MEGRKGQNESKSRGNRAKKGKEHEPGEGAICAPRSATSAHLTPRPRHARHRTTRAPPPRISRRGRAIAPSRCKSRGAGSSQGAIRTLDHVTRAVSSDTASQLHVPRRESRLRENFPDLCIFVRF